MKIMLAGNKGCGKDTAADFLVSQYGGLQFSFAGPLYDIMYFYQDTMKVERHKDRVFLQTIGSLARQKNPDVWVNLCLRKAWEHPKENIYITDGRYFNELEAGKDDGFYIVHVVSNNSVRQERRPNESIEDSHPSENGYPADYEFDFTVENNGTVEELYDALETVVAEIIKKESHVIY